MLRNLFSVWVAGLLTSALLSAEELKQIQGKVIKVSDGDTITVLDQAKQTHKIRFYGIDAPEKKQAYGEKSREHLAKMIAGKEVTVEVKTIDRYGRVVGVVHREGLANSTNYFMVADGYAWWYQQYARKDKALENAQNKAKAAKLGLWGDGKPDAPWDWRKAQRSARQVAKTLENKPKGDVVETGYWLNSGSNVRHNSGCKHYKKSKKGRFCLKGEGRACKICGG